MLDDEARDPPLSAPLWCGLTARFALQAWHLARFLLQVYSLKAAAQSSAHAAVRTRNRTHRASRVLICSWCLV